MTAYSKFVSLGCAAWAAIVVCASAQADNTVVLETGPGYASGLNQGVAPYQAGDGGEFTALSPTLGVPAGYNLSAVVTLPSSAAYLGANTGIETFCVEDETYFWSGVAYDYSISPFIQVSNGGAFTNGVPFTNVPLSVGVAWLYQQFATGALSGYNYANPADRLVNAGQLQAAIWELQGPSADPDQTSVDLTNPFVSLAVAHFGGAVGNATAAEAANEFSVSVLDLYSTDGDGQINGVYQDQLIYTNNPVPDAASSAALLALALLAIGLNPRKQRI